MFIYTLYLLNFNNTCYKSESGTQNIKKNYYKSDSEYQISSALRTL